MYFYHRFISFSFKSKCQIIRRIVIFLEEGRRYRVSFVFLSQIGYNVKLVGTLDYFCSEEKNFNPVAQCIIKIKYANCKTFFCASIRHASKCSSHIACALSHRTCIHSPHFKPLSAYNISREYSYEYSYDKANPWPCTYI